MAAKQYVVAQLRRLIASGELTPGQKLPAEPALCDQLGASRGSLREAVRELEALGVLQARHGSGTYVSQLRPAEMMRGFAATVDLVPLDGLLELVEIRRVLESHAAGQAAARATAELDAELSELLAAMERETDHTALSDLDARFHQRICDAGGNESLAALVEVFRSRGSHYDIYSIEEVRRDSDKGHRAIAAAITARDPMGAALAAGAHITHTQDWLRRFRPRPH
ncbi:FadR/GntR family transcriptional regulator [Streptomyces sp. NPDC057681]|uniref:FadR/GntR family transcriptional regulator n=1 Tax=Streptomyces sp. NPDC057681 TaxID=3346209 RepID=UPI0036B5B3AE